MASVKTRGSLLLFSLMGMGPKKTWDATSNAAYSLDTDTGKWDEVHSVPGTVGRLGPRPWERVSTFSFSADMSLTLKAGKPPSPT